MIGDVIFFKGTKTLISQFIAKMTKSGYTHVGLIVDVDELTSAITIIESDRFIKTQIRKIYLKDEMHEVYTVEFKTPEQQERIVQYAMKKIGIRYDYWQIAGLFISFLIGGKRYSFFNSANKLICSELIDIVYIEAGVKRKHLLDLGNITPQDLLGLYDFKPVRKEG